MKLSPKIFIGSMSKNIVDATINYCNNHHPIAIISSRRQIEFNGGYVNKWRTNDFCEYIKSRTANTIIVRDHAGPSQGESIDDGIESFDHDMKSFDIIHIDVWKKYKNIRDGIDATKTFLLRGYGANPNTTYEIGTEESIRKFNASEIEEIISTLKNELNRDIFSKIKYVVVQSGTSLHENTNTGKYNSERLIEMTAVVKKYGLLSKEHNGDYLDNKTVEEKFKLGLDSINIAPEFGQIETKIILDSIIKNKPNLYEELYNICYLSGKWKKWVSSDFDINDKNKLINICGHYVFSNADFLSIKSCLEENIDEEIQIAITNRLEELVNLSSR